MDTASRAWPNDVAAPARFDAAFRAHDRVRLFCRVLEVLAEDLHQAGREPMALSLSEFAGGELARLLRWERRALLSEFSRVCPNDSVARLMYDTFLQHHLAVVDALPPVADGLDRIARGQSPEPLIEFRLDVLRVAESLRLHLDWQRRDFLPCVLERLPRRDIARLDESVAQIGGAGSLDATRWSPSDG